MKGKEKLFQPTVFSISDKGAIPFNHSITLKLFPQDVYQTQKEDEAAHNANVYDNLYQNVQYAH